MQQRNDEEKKADIICLSEFIRVKLVTHTHAHTRTLDGFNSRISFQIWLITLSRLTKEISSKTEGINTHTHTHTHTHTQTHTHKANELFIQLSWL